ncbi:MAG TPA: hypothetical protein VGK99_18685 [Acidobacteriota bacterium]
MAERSGAVGTAAFNSIKPAVFLWGGRQQSMLGRKGADKDYANGPCRRLSP